MENCRAVNKEIKSCKIALVESRLTYGNYISKCNTGKIMAFDFRKNDREVLKEFFEKIQSKVNESGKKTEEILKKLANQFKILAICYENIISIANKLEVELKLDEDVCICVLNVDKNNLYLKNGNKNHVFLKQYRNCAFVRDETIRNMIKKLN